MEHSKVAAARRLAEEVLLPDAEAVDAADRVPQTHLDALDRAGITGLAADGADLEERVDVTAALAGGCLATAFLWIQHQGALSAVARSEGAAGGFTGELASGALRAGVAITAVFGPRPLRIEQAEGGWTISGSAPWVTGWGVVDVLRVAAVQPDGAVRTVLADVGPGMTGDRVALVAARAAGTATVAFDSVHVPADRALEVVSVEQWSAADAAGLAGNGALALGVAGRAAAMLAESGHPGWVRPVEQAREALLAADVDALPEARASCSALALHVAGALAAHDGARGVSAGSRSDRLLREAHFLLGFGSRPAIRTDLLHRLGL